MVVIFPLKAHVRILTFDVSSRSYTWRCTVKKIRSLILTVLFVPFFAHAQSYPLLCSWAGGGYGKGLAHPTQYAARVSLDVAQVLGVNPISIYQGGVPNASATVINNGPVIVYSPQFLNAMAQRASGWAPVSIIAHEYGHHLNLDTTYYGQFKHAWTKELQADFVSGLAMGRLGASLEEATRALRANFNFGSQSHPDTPKRLDALAQGWYRAQM